MTKAMIGDYLYFVVPKGTRIEIPNPLWNEDDESTQHDVKVMLLEDITVCTTSEKHKVLILDEKP